MGDALENLAAAAAQRTEGDEGDAEGRAAFNLGAPSPGDATLFGAHSEARGAREGSPVWAGADVRAKKYLAVTGLREPPGRPPPGRPQPGRQAFERESIF